MPIVLLIALAASLGIHAAALFGPDIELSAEPESLPLMAELRALPKPPALVPLLEPEPEVKPENPPLAQPKPVKLIKPPPRKAQKVVRASPVLNLPGDVPAPTIQPDPSQEAIAEAIPASESVSESAPEEVIPVAISARMPPRGVILYRVDRGDSNFEVGSSKQSWEIADGRYRLTSEIETTGIVWLFKSIRIETESRGALTAEGLRPESFVTRRNGQETKEKAFFDWDAMKVQVGDRAEQDLVPGSQDVLSFNYQLGYLPNLEAGTALSIATGRKYAVYRLEVVGEEEIEVPAGRMRTLHLRAPGVNITELWLAYDHLMLPVKMRHVDAKGDSIVQVATQIQLSPE